MECPHLSSSVCIAPDSAKFPNGSPSSWCCSVCRSNKSPWVCLTCSSVHCGRYVNGHAKKHYEDAQIPLTNHKKSEKQEKAQHTVCMDCSSYSTYWSQTSLLSPGICKLSSGVCVVIQVRRCKSRCDVFSLSNTGKCAFGFKKILKLVIPFLFAPRGYQQQDAHEFMRYLLDHLHLELQGGFNGISRSAILQENSALSASNKCCINGASTVVTAIFGGILQNEVNCLICGTESRKFDPFLDLSLDIPSQFRSKRSKNQENGPVCSLRDCLRSFTDLEELDETELYMCHKCKKKQKSTKKFWIQKLPKVLCLHLKRFHWTAYLRNKVDTYVEFPLRGLDMKCYLLEPENSGPESCLYDLAAVVVHHGSGVGSGHYTAYATHEGRWFHFNDSTVTLTDEDTVVKAKAYILFYVERQAKAGSDKL
nr:ubiquitin carboxyl-terminal hydrolase 3 [Vicugna pacos]